jgi:hypothetical protein
MCRALLVKKKKKKKKKIGHVTTTHNGKREGLRDYLLPGQKWSRSHSNQIGVVVRPTRLD